MTTPNPRGFPRRSVEATICETLADRPKKSPAHWNFDPEADKAQRRENRAGTSGSSSARKSRVNSTTIADALALLQQLQEQNETKPND